jgi:hypothetical protein
MSLEWPASGEEDYSAPGADTLSDRALPRVQPAAKVERSDRQRTILRGKVVFGLLASRSLDCVIRDLSPSGAKIRLAGPELLPNVVWLLDLCRGQASEAQVVWARDRDAGLKFLRTRSLSEEIAPDFRAMRQLWLDCLPR